MQFRPSAGGSGWELAAPADISLRVGLNPTLASLLLPPATARKVAEWRPQYDADFEAKVRLEPGGGIHPEGALTVRDVVIEPPTRFVTAPIKIPSGRFRFNATRLDIENVKITSDAIQATVQGNLAAGRARLDAKLACDDLTALERVCAPIFKDENFIEGRLEQGTGWFETLGPAPDPSLNLAQTLRRIGAALANQEFRYRADGRVRNGALFPRHDAPADPRHPDAGGILRHGDSLPRGPSRTRATRRGVRVEGEIKIPPHDLPKLAFRAKAKRIAISDWFGPWFPSHPPSLHEGRVPPLPKRRPGDKRKLELSIKAMGDEWFIDHLFGLPLKLEGQKVKAHVVYEFAPGKKHRGQLIVHPSRFLLTGGDCRFEGAFLFPTQTDAGEPIAGLQEFLYRCADANLGELARDIGGAVTSSQENKKSKRKA
jgi:hypothetical protein